MRRALIGTGFCAPPAGESLPDMRPWLGDEKKKLADDESRTRAISNSVLERNGQPILHRLSDLYGQADQNLLTSYRELDHFGPRDDATYWGTVQACPGVRPVWPTRKGKRIFAYLKRTKGLAESLRALGQCGQPTIVFAPWVTDEIRARFSHANLHFSPDPLDMNALVRETDVAVFNGTHGATAEFLLAGKPILQLPIYLEQELVARRTVELGAGLAAKRTSFSDIRGKLDAVLKGPQFRENAVSFAAKYATRNREQSLADMIAVIDALAI